MSTAHSSGTVSYVGQADFAHQVLESDVPVLVDFYADWCGPCRALGPVLDQLAEAVPDAKIVKVDVDENPELAARYRIDSIPALMVFKNGRVTAQQNGLANLSQLKRLLDK